MTITSRGAVAPSGDDPGTSDGMHPTPTTVPDAAALDVVVDEVADHATVWARTGASARADLLQQVITDTMAVADEWLAAACEAKGLTPGTTEAGEELFTGIGTFVRMARLLRDALRDIAKDGKPAFAGPCARPPTVVCGSRSSRPMPSTGSPCPRRRPRSTCSPASPATRSSPGRPPPMPIPLPMPARRSSSPPAMWLPSGRAMPSPSSSWRARSS